VPETNIFVRQGMILFIDYLIVAVTNWAYWLLVSKLTSPSEIGEATTVYSLAILIGTSTQLGLEYTILKRSHTEQSRVFGTVLAVESIITCAAIPVMVFVINDVYYESLRDFLWLAVGILATSSLGFVNRFVLLGTSYVKSVLVIDMIGTGLRFVVGYTLVILGFGADGLLISLLAQGAFITGATLLVLIKVIGLRIVSVKMKYAKEILLDGLVNTPYKLSKVFVIYLSVVLLAAFGITSSDVGIFYVSLMISIVGGSLALSIAYMVIPASSKANRDLSSDSTRIGLSLTAPIIAGLLVAPKFVLSIFGPQYTTGDMLLLVLSMGILPYCITINAMSSFNNTREQRKIILMGAIEILALLLVFSFLVPKYGILGAGLSILIAFSASSIPAMIWCGLMFTRHVAISTICIAAGWTAGYMAGLVIPTEQPLIQISFSISITLIAVFILKNITPTEIKLIVKTITNRT
jgi:O-antigen/teichoic acid export membrane protein